MTCILALATHQTAYIAGDRMISDDESSTWWLGTDSKVWRSHGALFGVAGGGSPDRFRARWHPSSLTPSALREATARVVRELGPEVLKDIDLLLAVPGRVYTVQEDGTLWGVRGVHGVGSGSTPGVAAARAALRWGATPSQALREGVRQSAAVSLGVGGPIDSLEARR